MIARTCGEGSRLRWVVCCLRAGKRISSHVWQRQYDKALVVVNLPGAREPYEVRLERPARDSFAGESGVGFMVAPGDGRVLVAE